MKITMIKTGKKCFFATQFNNGAVFTHHCSHLEMIEAIFNNAKSDEWIVENEMSIYFFQVIEALKMRRQEYKIQSLLNGEEKSLRWIKIDLKEKIKCYSAAKIQKRGL